MGFREERRQKFLDVRNYTRSVERLNLGISGDAETLANETLSDRARRSFAWSIASEGLELLILQYTGGGSLAGLRGELPAVIEAFDIFIPLDNPRPNGSATFFL